MCPFFGTRLEEKQKNNLSAVLRALRSPASSSRLFNDAQDPLVSQPLAGCDCLSLLTPLAGGCRKGFWDSLVRHTLFFESSFRSIATEWDRMVVDLGFQSTVECIYPERNTKGGIPLEQAQRPKCGAWPAPFSAEVGMTCPRTFDTLISSTYPEGTNAILKESLSDSVTFNGHVT